MVDSISMYKSLNISSGTVIKSPEILTFFILTKIRNEPKRSETSQNDLVPPPAPPSKKIQNDPKQPNFQN